VAEQVRAVGGDFEFQQNVGVEHFLHRFADFGVFRKDEQAVLAGWQADLEAAQSMPLDSTLRMTVSPMVKPPGSSAPGARRGPCRRPCSSARRRRSGGAALAAIDLRDLQAVGIRVLDGFLDLRDDDSCPRDAFGNDAFHLHAGEGEQVVDFLDGFAADRSRWVESQLRETFMGRG
jgi:hypothetical protein